MPPETKITVEATLAEAFEVGAVLKLHSREFSALADLMQREGHAENSAHLKGKAAMIDAFADRLYRTFLSDEEIQQIDEHVDTPV